MSVDRKSVAPSPLAKTWPLSNSLEYQHPLDPLSAAEIARAVSLIKSQCSKEISDSYTFISVSLLEPPRETIWNYQHLLMPSEQIHAILKMDRRAIGYVRLSSLYAERFFFQR
jgi:Cu2+-containing amine oxidase